MGTVHHPLLSRAHSLSELPEVWLLLATQASFLWPGHQHPSLEHGHEHAEAVVLKTRGCWCLAWSGAPTNCPPPPFFLQGVLPAFQTVLCHRDRKQSNWRKQEGMGSVFHPWGQSSRQCLALLCYLPFSSLEVLQSLTSLSFSGTTPSLPAPAPPILLLSRRPI